MPLRYALSALASVASSAVVLIGGRLTERGRVRHEIAKRPALTPNAAEGDHVRVTGTVRTFERALVAPLTGRTCVAYRSRASVRSAQPRGVYRSPMSQPDAMLLVPFMLESGGDHVLVDGDHALFDVPATRLTAADRARQQQFIVLHGFRSLDGFGAGFKEVLIEPGMQVSVVGVLMRDVALAPPSEEGMFREGPAPTIRLTGSREHPLAIGLAR